MTQNTTPSKIGTTERSINKVMIAAVSVITIGVFYPLHLFRVGMWVEAGWFALFIPIGLTAIIINHRQGWNKMTVIAEDLTEDGKLRTTFQHPNGELTVRTTRIR
jgi:hypothetical protein